MLEQLEAGARRVTGHWIRWDARESLSQTHSQLRRDNPLRGAYVTVIEGCDKSCAYCVVPFTRGPERSRTSRSVMEEVRPGWRARVARKFSLLRSRT